jgi:hypothetical protein
MLNAFYTTFVAFTSIATYISPCFVPIDVRCDNIRVNWVKATGDALGRLIRTEGFG